MVKREKSAVVVLMAGLSIVMLLGAGQSSDGDGEAALALRSIREIREVVLIKSAEDGFFNSSDQPGMVLTFGIKAPKGKRLVGLQQPKKVVARDSTGRDLSGIKPDFMGEVEYISLVETWNDEPIEEMKLHLAQTDRGATSFSVRARFEASVFSGTEQFTVKLDKEWTKLDTALTGGKAIEMRFSDAMGSSGIELKPHSAREVFEQIEVMVAGSAEETSGSVTDYQTITYMVDKAFKSPVTVKLTVRKGFETIPMTVDVQGQRLP